MNTRAHGFTLIEVLIALAIVSIALSAIMYAISQNIRGTSYLQDKTICLWVGQQVLSEARVKLITLSNSNPDLQGKTMMLDREWFWQLHQMETPNKQIKKRVVQVFNQSTKQDLLSPLCQLDSYFYEYENAIRTNAA